MNILYLTFICVTYFGVPSPGNCMYILIGNKALPGSDVLYLAPANKPYKYFQSQKAGTPPLRGLRDLEASKLFIGSNIGELKEFLVY